MTFAEYLAAQEEEGRREAREGKEFTGLTWHGWYAYMREKDLFKPYYAGFSPEQERYDD